MRRTDTVIIGGGQAGLAMSRCLSACAVDHVVLERGRVGERWRSERWESLRLLTPNWQTRLPDFRYEGPDPDGYMTVSEVVGHLDRYARAIAAPLMSGTTVLGVEHAGSGFTVETDRGAWSAANVVIATGHCDLPAVPAFAGRLTADIFQTVPSRYRRPDDFPEGGVLVVGASSSGVQLADEIHQSGRPVTLAVGKHIRLPRTYRGRDILWWMDQVGILDERIDQVASPEASRQQPSLQLVGRPDHASLDLPILERRGVRLVGRVIGIDGPRIHLADDLIAHTAAADIRMARLLVRIEEFIAAKGLDSQVPRPEPFVPFCWPAPAPTSVDLGLEGIRSVVWATGFRRSYPWLKVPVLDERGEIRHQGGVTSEPGLYVLGLQFLRSRKSSFLDGVGDDARALAAHIARRLRQQRSAVA